MPLDVDTDDLSSMSGEIARRTPKTESLYANTSEDLSFLWDVMEANRDRNGTMMPVPEIQPPLLNEDYENLTLADVSAQPEPPPVEEPPPDA